MQQQFINIPHTSTSLLKGTSRCCGASPTAQEMFWPTDSHIPRSQYVVHTPGDDLGMRLAPTVGHSRGDWEIGTAIRWLVLSIG